MHVIFICNELPPASAGGIGHCVNLIAPRIAAAGHRVDIVGIYDRQYDWQLAGCQVHVAAPRVSIARRILQRWPLRLVVPDSTLENLRHLEVCAAIQRAISTRVARNGPLVIEWPSYQGQCNWSVQGVCHVLRIQGATAMATYEGDPAFNRCQHHEIETARQVKNWIGVSHWSLDEFKRVTDTRPSRSTIIHNPVDCTVFHPSDRAIPDETVLYAGTLCDRKGDTRLAVAANRFLQEFPRATLCFIGRHDRARAEIIYSLIRTDLHDRVEVRKNATQGDLAEAMRSSAIFAMPSQGETFGMVYAEAMASGIPVVAGNTTGIPEVVPDGRAGLLVDAGSTEGIADAISRLLGSREMRASMGAEGRRIAEAEYSVEACSEKTMVFHEECQSLVQ